MSHEIWTVIESKVVQSEINNHLSEVELDALRTYLAVKPWVGVWVQQYPELWVLRWGKHIPIDILYTINIEDRTIFLWEVQLAEGETGQVEISKDIPKAAWEEALLWGKAILRYAVAKELLDYLKEKVKDWWF